MASLFEFKDFRGGTIELAKAVAERGERVSPRGYPTHEIRNAVFTIADPRDAVPVGTGRNLPTKIVAAETLQFLSGWSDLVQVDAASNGNFMQFSDDGKTLAGAYGPRMFFQLYELIDKLMTDRDSRQAGLTIWTDDTVAIKTKDMPCTVSMFFDIRDERLNMTTFMRSSDIWLGIPIDVAVFTRIQGCVAWALDVEIGEYTHHSRSLHVYDRDLGKIDSLELVPAMPVPIPTDGLDHVGTTNQWPIVVGAASAAARGTEVLCDGMRWFADKLKDLPAGHQMCPYCRRWVGSEPMDRVPQVGHHCYSVRSW